MILEIRKHLSLAKQSSVSIDQALNTFDDQMKNHPEFKQFEAYRQILAETAQKMKETNQALEANFATSSEQIRELNDCLEIATAEASIDKLTTVANRAYFDRKLEEEVEKANETGTSLSLLMLDVDRFKSVNDTYGHQIGDAVLRFVARMIRTNIKGQDLVARYGGEEFAVILPKTSLKQGVLVADKIRQAISALEAQHKATGESIGTITVSVGVSALKTQDTPETLIDRADLCLYAAKRSGRNQVKCHADITEEKSDAA